MRAKTINFQRGQDPKTAMQIGKKAEIVQWFNDLDIKPQYYEIDDNLNITVNTSLYLYSYTTELPDNLTVNGDLYLTYAKITKLPHNLTIAGNLYLYDGVNAEITEYQKELVVAGKIINLF